jgi:hypothetical protein
MLNTVLGLIAALGFIGYALPQIRAVHRAPRLAGYSLTAWSLLMVAILAIQVQLIVANLWVAAIAQVFNTAAASYTYYAVLTKGRE